MEELTKEEKPEAEAEKIREISQIEEKLSEMKKKLFTLEWDISHNQLNPGKKTYYDSLKKECEELYSTLKKLMAERNIDIKTDSKNDLEDESEQPAD